MELYDKLSLLEEKADRLLTQLREGEEERRKLRKEYDELLEKFLFMEEELGRVNADKEAARQKIESIMEKLG